MRASLILMLMLAACNSRSSSRQPVEETPDLEQAAIARGAIADAAGTDPTGLFLRRHEGGTDAICIVPDEEGEYRFGAVARSGGKARCAGRGRAKKAGQLLVMRFDKPSRCILVAQYEGDRVALAGAVDMECDKLCTSRSSFAGVSVPRVSGSVESAGAISAPDGAPLCKSAS